MAGHAQLKIVVTECSKTQIRLTVLMYVKDNNTNINAKFHLHPPMTSEKKIFEYFFRKFNISVATATNQNQ